MGYRTEYYLDIYKYMGEGTPPRIEDIMIDFQSQSEEAKYSLEKDGACLREWGWYDHENDMIGLSTKYPEVVFRLSGFGEECADTWADYYLNGKVQHCLATLVMLPFDPDKLQEPK